MFDFELKIGLKFIFALNFPPGTPSMLPKIVTFTLLPREYMKQTTEIAILPFKVLELAEIIAEKKRLSVDDALFYLYDSELY